MPAVVWVSIKYNVALLPPPDDQILRVFVFGRYSAEQTFFWLLFFFECPDVGGSPRRMQVSQRPYLQKCHAWGGLCQPLDKQGVAETAGASPTAASRFTEYCTYKRIGTQVIRS